MTVYSEEFYQRRRFHFLLSVSFFLLFALGDSFFTLDGMDGNIEMEGNPVMKWLMIQFGFIGGLIVGKGGVLIVAIILALLVVRGVEEKAEWVLCLAITPMTKAYMRKAKRYWVAFIPIYLVALSQVYAVCCWIFLV